MGWALFATWIEFRIVPWQWPPEVDWLRYVNFPGIFVMVALGAVHGFGSAWIDNGIVIVGTAVFWSLLTILTMWLWSRRR
jgi:hypothetical protein